MKIELKEITIRELTKGTPYDRIRAGLERYGRKIT